MELGVILDMAAGLDPDRVAVVGPDGASSTVGELDRASHALAQRLVDQRVRRVGYLASSDRALPITLFAAALAGVPFCPFNYRLADEQLIPQVTAERGTLMIAGDREAERLVAAGVRGVMRLADVHGPVTTSSTALPVVDDDTVAVELFTSGTTSTPKAALLRHRHLTSYLLANVEFASAAPQDAVLVSVPPYHVAGIATILSNLFAGRRIVYLDPFEPHRWLDVARREAVTHAMVVPTMLARIIEALDGSAAQVPSLRSLAYGGAPMPPTVIATALEAFGETDFVNAYGLTETSSTITVLDGDDHRAALHSVEPEVAARLGSVGRPVPGLELEIRREDGSICDPGEAGAVFVRGDQVAGEYAGSGAADDGWFATRDLGHLDAGGYLFIHGRSDDTIIRGGENIAPAEIEHVLLEHPTVADVAVIGVADAEWGQSIAAVIVPAGTEPIDSDALADWTRSRLRSSKTPTRFVTRDDLPRTDTGKILRRVLRTELEDLHEG